MYEQEEKPQQSKKPAAHHGSGNKSTKSSKLGNDSLARRSGLPRLGKGWPRPIWARSFQSQLNPLQMVVDDERNNKIEAADRHTVGSGLSVKTSAVNRLLHIRYVGELARLNRQSLLDELSRSGIKYTPENIVDIRKTQSGKIVFLETGNRQAGLEHILARHKQDFSNVGINTDQIPDAVMTAVTQGKVIGYQGKNKGRRIYDTVYNDTRHQIGVSVSDNGFIVGANPQSRLSPYITE